LKFLDYPKKAGFEAEKVKTDYGVIDLNDLQERAKGAAALIYTQPAGYFAEQPIEDIYNACNSNECLVIMDASGSVGSELCDGNFADIIVGSFGKWKPVELGYGGFISFKSEENFINSKNVLSELSFDEGRFDGLHEKLKNVKERYGLFYKLNKKIKKDLNRYKILHNDKKGINVAAAFDSDDEKRKIIDYCSANGYEYTLCPRYIRVERDAVSIEVKRIRGN